MSKKRLFIENFFVYGLGGIISKIVPFIMIPIVTRLMPNSTYFGINDMSQTIVSLFSSFAVMGMYDAMYRMFFENESIEYKKCVCSTAMMFCAISSFVVFLIMILFKDVIALFFLEDSKYAYVIYMTAFSTFIGATNNLVSAPTRMQNKRRIFLITNTISPLIAYGISIPMLLKGYYVIALPLATLIASIVKESIFGVLNHKWFDFSKFDTCLLKLMLKFALPLMPNMLIYWIFNSSDKVMITRLVGIGEAGIYSVGSKLGMASQLIYTAFAGGWQYFAFSTMKEKDQVESNSKVFEYLGIISYISTVMICIISKPLYELLFTEEYHKAYIVAPYLFLAPLLQMLYQVSGNQFLVIKKTWPMMLILSAGLVLNIGFNYILIPLIGIEGAAIATLLGYVVSDIICTLALTKMKLMVVSARFLVATLLMIIGMIAWRLVLQHNLLAEIIWLSVYGIVIVLLYQKEIRKVMKI